MPEENIEDWNPIAVTLPSRYGITAPVLIDAGIRTRKKKI